MGAARPENQPVFPADVSMSLKYRLLFDADCPLCVRFADATRRFGDATLLEVVPLQRYVQLDPSIPEEELLKEVHLIGEDGSVFRGSKAIEKVIKLAPKLSPMRWMIESGAGKKSLGLFYRIANRFRRGCRKCRK